MPDHGTWDVISGTDSARDVLGVDFPAWRHREADLCDLAARIGPGYRFLRPMPPTRSYPGRSGTRASAPGSRA